MDQDAPAVAVDPASIDPSACRGPRAIQLAQAPRERAPTHEEVAPVAAGPVPSLEEEGRILSSILFLSQKDDRPSIGLEALIRSLDAGRRRNSESLR